MPEREHAKLSRQAKKKGLTGERKDAYVYGTLNKVKKRRAAKRKKMAKK